MGRPCSSVLPSYLQGALEEGDQDYAMPVRLTPECIGELVWWDRHLTNWNRWCLISQLKTITSDRDRCINHRLGSYMWGSPNRGTLVRDRESFAHKLPRTSSSDTGCQMLCQRQRGYYDYSINGQHHCNSLHQQTGWNSDPELNHLTKDLWLWCGQEYYCSSNASSRCSECDGRQRIEGNEAQNRLEALPRRLLISGWDYSHSVPCIHVVWKQDRALSSETDIQITWTFVSALVFR